MPPLASGERALCTGSEKPLTLIHDRRQHRNLDSNIASLGGVKMLIQIRKCLRIELSDARLDGVRAGQRYDVSAAVALRWISAGWATRERRVRHRRREDGGQWPQGVVDASKAAQTESYKRRMVDQPHAHVESKPTAAAGRRRMPGCEPEAMGLTTS
jgi:hypothetical protein